jgi:hypothetical protein
VPIEEEEELDIYDMMVSDLASVMSVNQLRFS